MSENANLRVLIVDDDVSFTQVLSRRLEKKGYICQCCHHAHEVLPTQSLFDPAFILLDLQIGSDSGLPLISPMIEHSKDVKIFVVTGFASISTAVAAVKLGATDYLPKPIDSKVLLDKLSENSKLVSDISSESTQGRMSTNRLEWEYIQQVLASHDNNVSATARALNMHRRTLQRKLAKKPVGQ